MVFKGERWGVQWKANERESVEYYRALSGEESGKCCCEKSSNLPPLPTVTNNESSLNISSVVDYLMIDHGWYDRDLLQIWSLFFGSLDNFDPFRLEIVRVIQQMV